ncbi:MAG: hypothetical protein I3273_03220 [Candidatus Moeniiplasma glomeromycotorum]|nr:hypothetical protein [Candidatus Moeniiplasma glomeromycotorum]MCE8162215.1 hypothetical protein [Candidatus Moeniiplasma glomeromycotorum]MCE8163318.1 hypothetical protein [Candidatus Moeniiplasma glomeromycotorum]MCE8166129.1 hypothetical protein [Candidatus Moeniiplasma glomeromycotorum]MCE8166614.1 hypothetical protein [Candidatus Moeniiplasma glomeromycotorum]
MKRKKDTLKLQINSDNISNNFRFLKRLVFSDLDLPEMENTIGKQKEALNILNSRKWKEFQVKQIFIIEKVKILEEDEQRSKIYIMETKVEFSLDYNEKKFNINKKESELILVLGVRYIKITDDNEKEIEEIFLKNKKILVNSIKEISISNWKDEEEMIKFLLVILQADNIFDKQKFGFEIRKERNKVDWEIIGESPIVTEETKKKILLKKEDLINLWGWSQSIESEYKWNEVKKEIEELKILLENVSLFPNKNTGEIQGYIDKLQEYSKPKSWSRWNIKPLLFRLQWATRNKKVPIFPIQEKIDLLNLLKNILEAKSEKNLDKSFEEKDNEIYEKHKEEIDKIKEIKSKELKDIAHDQLKDIAEIVMPNTEFDFAELKQEIKKLKTENLLNQLKIKKIELEEMISSVKGELNEEAQNYLLDSLLKKKVKIVRSNNNFASEKIEKIREILVKKLGQERLQNLLDKQSKVTQLEKKLEDLQEEQLETKIEVSPKSQ